MDNLVVAATERSPEIKFDAVNGALSLRGESYPEDASAVFGPIFAWLDGFLALDKPADIRFDVELIYFNSSSAKALMNIFQMLEKAAEGGRSIVINWIFAEDDETMSEFGEDFREDLHHVQFNLVTSETAA